MKAIVFHEHGGPDVLSYEDVPEPQPGPGQVKVRVHASSLNHLDVWVRGGVPGPQIPMPHILGNDIAGEVAELGDGVEGWSVGERVVVSPGMGAADSTWSLHAADSSDPEYRMLGWHEQGGWCQYQAVDARRLIRVSDRWTMEEWASTPLVFVTAWHMLFRHGRLQPGQTVLVQAAGSGVGAAALQLARWAGARVLATAGSDAKCSAALELGADEAINYREEDFADRCRRATGGSGVDLIIDHVGADTFDRDLKALAKGGRLVTCGATSGFRCELNLNYLFVRQLSITGSFMGAFVELQAAVEALARGDVRPVVDSVFPLDEAADAMRHLESRSQFGKVVLKVV